jgi:hypothetical protein
VISFLVVSRSVSNNSRIASSGVTHRVNTTPHEHATVTM